jgi:hypothetical protein
VSKDIKREMTKRRKREHKKKISIVEDDEIVTQLVKEVLEIEGFQVDVIISDCDIPQTICIRYSKISGQKENMN